MARPFFVVRPILTPIQHQKSVARPILARPYMRPLYCTQTVQNSVFMGFLEISKIMFLKNVQPISRKRIKTEF